MELNEQQKQNRSKKMMVWFGMISMAMTFAGLTSAYVVSSTRADWLSNFELPQVFTYSTMVILFSSASFYWAKKQLQQGRLGSFKQGLFSHPCPDHWFCCFAIPRVQPDHRIGLLFYGGREFHHHLFSLCTCIAALGACFCRINRAHSCAYSRFIE